MYVCVFAFIENVVILSVRQMVLIVKQPRRIIL
jgi:hypothetical protein